MEAVTIEGIISNYKLLGDPDMETRQRANLYLMGLIDHEEVWKITQEMIVRSQSSDFQLLGAQILYQKVQRDLDQLQLNERLELKTFIFGQLQNQNLTLPTIRKLGSSAALIAISLMLDHWKSFITDMVAFMESSALQLRNGLVVLERIPEQLKGCYRVKHGHKMLIREQLFSHGDLLCRVYSSAILLNQDTLTSICLQGLQNWIVIGYPLLKYNDIVKLLLEVMNSNQLWFQNCCRIIKQGLLQAARQKYVSISDAEFAIEREKYSKEQMQSLSIILKFLQSHKASIFNALENGHSIEQIQIYSSIIKEILLSYGFLLKEDIGYELLQIMFRVVSSVDLKLSYSTFQFWIDFCQKLMRMKTEDNLALKFWQIVEHLLDIIISKIILNKESIMAQVINDDDTIDDLSKISIGEYRKEAQNIIKFTFDFFSEKKQKEGSLIFFKKALTLIQKQKSKGQALRGLQASIYLIKSALESMVKQYDTNNIVEYITFLMGEITALSHLPPKLIAEVLNLIKDCNRQIKEKDSLFIGCLSFCLKHVSSDITCHYAVYAFQSLMQSINELSNDSLINDLMTFYSSSHFTKDSILQKVLQGILTVIAKLTNKQAMEHYLMRIVSGVQLKYKQIESGDPSANSYISLIEIKTLLDSFDHFRGHDQEQFKKVFLKISSFGLTITTNIIQNYIAQRKKFSTVGDLGASMSVIRNSLRICENNHLSELPIKHYINLMNIVLTIFTPSRQFFNEYSNLTEIIVKVFTQFVGQNIPDLTEWLRSALPGINSFFLTQFQRYTLKNIDPDFLKCYFSILEATIIYNKDIHLSQPEHEQIYELVVHTIQYVNQINCQRKAVNLLYQCVQMRDAYHHKAEKSLKALFASIPTINSLSHTNLGRIMTILLEKVDLKGKENITRQLLEYQPYQTVDRDIKQIISKLFAFTVESKVDRYIKGAFNDLNEVRWKKTGSELALHLELRFTKWKREYNQKIKGGTIPT